MKKLGLVIIVWLACSFYAFGTLMADLDWKNTHEWLSSNYTSRDNIGIVSLVSLTGPIGAVVVAATTNFNQHGWELWEKNRDQR